MMRQIKILFVFFTMVIMMCACSGKLESFKTGRYEYTQEGFTESGLPINFSITIHSDGRYSYAESVALSSATEGTWEISDGKLILTDELGTNYFHVGQDEITFISEGSDNFTHVDVKDGEVFAFRK